MRRREFMTVLGGAAIGWPLAARAQGERMRRIGVLMGIAESDPARQSFVTAFTEALQELGWSSGRNIHIEYRWGAGDAERIRDFARELVEMQLDLIVGHTTPVVAALKAQTRTIPIVFTQVSDPVGSGFIDGFAKPGANITGFTNLESSMGSKLEELLKEVAPHNHAGSRHVQSGHRARSWDVFPASRRGRGAVIARGGDPGSGSQ
jgi:putative tryptophan/tyrosine transport system substrate-binding protein